MKLISWNVNGLRAVLRKNFLDYLAEERPDALCLQETKACEADVEAVWPSEYGAFWNSAEKKGYSGTAILTRIPPVQVTRGIGVAEHEHFLGPGRQTLGVTRRQRVDVVSHRRGRTLRRPPRPAVETRARRRDREHETRERRRACARGARRAASHRVSRTGICGWLP